MKIQRLFLFILGSIFMVVGSIFLFFILRAIFILKVLDNVPRTYSGLIGMALCVLSAFAFGITCYRSTKIKG